MGMCRVPVSVVGSVAAAVAVVVAGAGTASAGSWTSTEVGAAGPDGWTVTEVAEGSVSAGGAAGRDVSSRPVASVASGRRRTGSVSRTGARRPWRPAVVCRVGHDGGVWTVHGGDTLGLVSRCTGVGLSRLTEAGDITDPDRLRIGQRIEIPAPQAGPSRSAASSTPAVPVAAVPVVSTTPSTTPTAVPVVPVAVAPGTPVVSTTPTAVPVVSTTPPVAVVTVTVLVAPATSGS